MAWKQVTDTVWHSETGRFVLINRDERWNITDQKTGNGVTGSMGDCDEYRRRIEGKKA